jgi:hypothetical protein
MANLEDLVEEAHDEPAPAESSLDETLGDRRLLGRRPS